MSDEVERRLLTPVASGTHGVVLGVLFALLWMMPKGAVAQSGELSLEWHGGPDCDNGKVVADQVRQMLGESFQIDPDIRFLVRVSKQDPTWQLQLEVTEKERTYQRTLMVETCQAATDAGALLIALTLDPAMLGGQGVDVDDRLPLQGDRVVDEPGSSGAGAVSTRVRILPSAALTWHRSWSRLQGDVAVLAAMNVGTFPFAGVSPAIYGGIRVGGFSLQLGGRAVFPRQWEVPGLTLGTITFWSIDGGLRCGYFFQHRRLAVGPVLELYVSYLGARSDGLIENGQGGATTVGMSGGVHFLWRLGPLFSLRFESGAQIPFVRPSFQVLGQGVVHQPSPLALYLGFGLSVHFFSQ